MLLPGPVGSAVKPVRYFAMCWVSVFAPLVSGCGGNENWHPSGLDAHQSWRAGYETARRDYRGVFVPRSMQQQLAGASTETWCTQELATDTRPVNSTEFVEGCIAYTAGEAPR